MQYQHPAAYSNVTGHQRDRTESKHNGGGSKLAKCCCEASDLHRPTPLSWLWALNTRENRNWKRCWTLKSYARGATSLCWRQRTSHCGEIGHASRSSPNRHWCCRSICFEPLWIPLLLAISSWYVLSKIHVAHLCLVVSQATSTLHVLATLAMSNWFSKKSAKSVPKSASGREFASPKLPLGSEVPRENNATWNPFLQVLP